MTNNEPRPEKTRPETVDPVRPDPKAPIQLEEVRYSVPGELWAFMREEKKWWLAPILLVLLLVGVVLILGETSVGPFIYALL